MAKAQTASANLIDVSDLAPDADGARHHPASQTAAHRLIAKARLVKRARFNAQARFEAKNMASISALTVVSMVAIAIGLYSAIYQIALPAQVERLLDFMTSIASLLVLSFGFIVALGSYQDKALRMQRCAMDLARMLDDLEALAPVGREELRYWTSRYNDIIQQCPFNHNDTDLTAARFDPDTTRSERRRHRAAWMIDVYGIYAVFFIALATFWWAAS